MNHLNFIVWVFFYPISVDVSNYFSRIINPDTEYSSEVKAFVAIIHLSFYFSIAYLLWEGK